MFSRDTVRQLERKFQDICHLIGLPYRVNIIEERHTLEELVLMIDKPGRDAIVAFMVANEKALKDPQGSVHNHQAWPGGWWDHTTEVMNYAVLFYRADPRPHAFSLSDALLVLFMHDVEKPWKYERQGERWVHRADMQTKAQHQAYRMALAEKWGITLSPEHINGIKYAEGELDDYSPRKRVAGELAAFAHCCDHYSARYRHNYPLAQNDEWPGAGRIQNIA